MTHFEPTAAQTRSLGLAALGLMVGAVFGRLDMAMIAVPFVVHLAWSWWHRPVRDVNVKTSPKTVVVAEGDALKLHVVVEKPVADKPAEDQPAERHWLSVQWPGVPTARFNPTHGAKIDVDDEVSVGFEPLRWGRYVTGEPGVQVIDPTGSWRDSTNAESATVTVRPDVVKLQAGSGVARPIGIIGAHSSTTRGDGTALADIRQFQPGDRLRRINWRVTSRTQRLHITSTHIERDTDILIVVDSLRDIAPPKGGASSLDATVRAITAITQHYVAFGDRVAVHDLGRRIGSVRPGTGPRQARRMIEVLARANRDAEQENIRKVPTLRSGTLVFFLSPLLTEGVLTEVGRLRSLGGEVIVIDTLPPDVGQVSTLGGDDDFWDEAWVIRRMEREHNVERLRELGIPVTPWKGVGSLAHVLLSMEMTRSAPRRAVGR